MMQACAAFGRARPLRRLLGAREGTAAVEFAILAVPFFAILTAIFDIWYAYAVSLSLDRATANIARQIRTGQAAASQMTADAFREAVCEDAMNWLGAAECMNNLAVSVQTNERWDDLAPVDPIDQDGNYNAPTDQFEIGTNNSIVVVQTFYTHRPLVPQLNPTFTTTKNGPLVIQAAASFRNEPWVAGERWTDQL